MPWTLESVLAKRAEEAFRPVLKAFREAAAATEGRASLEDSLKPLGARLRVSFNWTLAGAIPGGRAAAEGALPLEHLCEMAQSEEGWSGVVVLMGEDPDLGMRPFARRRKALVEEPELLA